MYMYISGVLVKLLIQIYDRNIDNKIKHGIDY